MTIHQTSQSLERSEMEGPGTSHGDFIAYAWSFIWPWIYPFAIWWWWRLLHETGRRSFWVLIVFSVLIMIIGFINMGVLIWD